MDTMENATTLIRPILGSNVSETQSVVSAILVI